MCSGAPVNMFRTHVSVRAYRIYPPLGGGGAPQVTPQGTIGMSVGSSAGGPMGEKVLYVLSTTGLDWRPSQPLASRPWPTVLPHARLTPCCLAGHPSGNP